MCERLIRKDVERSYRGLLRVLHQKLPVFGGNSDRIQPGKSICGSRSKPETSEQEVEILTTLPRSCHEFKDNKLKYDDLK
jgi:hypothetical protein